MKSVLAAAAALLALSAVTAQAAPGSPASAGGLGKSVGSAVESVRHGGPHRGYRRGRTEVITTAPSGVDLNTLLLLGTLGGGLGADAGLSAMLPLLLAQPQSTTVVETRRGRRR